MPLSYKTLPGDVDHLIADDHAIVERQFQHLEAGTANRRVMVDQIMFELALHAFAEETVLYPAWRDAGMVDASEDARRDHHVVKELLVQLAKTEPGDARFDNALARLMTEVRGHALAEEREELPRFRERVGAAKMAELGEKFLAAKRAAPTMPHPHAPDDGRLEKLVGRLAKPVDQLVAKASGKKKTLATDASGLLDAQAQAVVDAHSALGPLPFEILQPEQARAQPALDAAVKQVMRARGLEGPEPVGSVEDKIIPGPDGDLTLRVYKPLASASPYLPVVLWIHGGGWVLFDVETYDASCRGLANKAGCIVVSPEYRLAPEHPFPAAHDDVLTAYRWLQVNAASIGGDPARMAIGGESVGATMALATCRQLAEWGDPLPLFQALVYPLATTEPFGESMLDAADARPANRALISWMAKHAFAADPDAMRDPRVDLLSLGLEALEGLPPAHVITAERDPLRSQGEELARRLDAAGVPTTHTQYAGCMHEFFGAAAVLDQADHAQREVARYLTRAFGAHAANTRRRAA